MNTAAHNIQSVEKKRIVSLRVTVTFSLFFVGRFVRIQSLTNSNKLTIQLQAALCPHRAALSAGTCLIISRHVLTLMKCKHWSQELEPPRGVNGSMLSVINLYLDTFYSYSWYLLKCVPLHSVVCSAHCPHTLGCSRGVIQAWFRLRPPPLLILSCLYTAAWRDEINICSCETYLNI